MCEYSKFRIESNSYLLFDSIRNWRNYSKFSNTYLTVISRAIDMRFVCTLPSTSRCTHLMLNPVLCRVCSYPSHSPHHTRSPVRACVLPAPGLDHGIWVRYNGGRQTQRTVSWALTLLSVFLWIQLQHGDMLHLKYVVILVLPMSRTCHTLSGQCHACQKNHCITATATHSHRLADWQAQ